MKKQNNVRAVKIPGNSRGNHDSVRFPGIPVALVDKNFKMRLMKHTEKVGSKTDLREEVRKTGNKAMNHDIGTYNPHIPTTAYFFSLHHPAEIQNQWSDEDNRCCQNVTTNKNGFCSINYWNNEY